MMNQGNVFLATVIYVVVVVGLCTLLVFLAILPGIIAFQRRARNRWFILALNLFLGSTGIGWIAALIWACRAMQSGDQHTVDRRDQAGVGLLMNDIRQLPIFNQSANITAGTALTTGTSPEQVTDVIQRLADLAAKGYLAPDEYAALKAKLLARD